MFYCWLLFLLLSAVSTAGCWHKSKKHVQGIKRTHTNTTQTLTDCQHFCEMKVECRAIDWSPSTDPSCFLMMSTKTKPAEKKIRKNTHYELDRFCNRKLYTQLYTQFTVTTSG